MGALLVGRPSATAPRRALVVWGGVVATAALATVLAPDPLYALVGDTARMMGFTTTLLFAAVFLAGVVTGREALVTLTNMALAGGAVVAIAAVAQQVGVVDHAGRATSTMGNAAFLGAYLCVVLPLTVARALAEAGSRRWSIPLALLLGDALLASGTRAAGVGAAIGVGTVVAVLMPARRVLAVGGAIVVAALVIVAPVSARGAPGSGGTAEGRADTWRLVPAVIAERPLTGWGPEGFRRGFAQAMDAGWARTYFRGQLPDRAHNRFLDVAATSGLLGLAADAALLGFAALALRRATSSSDGAIRVATIGVSAGALAWLVQGQFLFDTFDVAALVWFLLGVAVAGVSPTERSSVGARVRILVAVLLVPIAAWSVVNLIADRRLQDSSGSSPRTAFARLADVAHLRPRDLDAYVLAGTAARASHDARILRSAHRLLAGAHDDEVGLADARVLAALGTPSSLASAATELTTLTRRRASDPRVWLVLADVRQRQGRSFDAARARERATMLTP